MTSQIKRNTSDLTNEKATENDEVTAFVFVNFASSGDVDALESLMKMNPARTVSWVNFADYDKRTPLHLASEEGHFPVVKLLVENGAKINVSDRWGATPLACAAAAHHTEIVRYLAAKGGDLGVPIDMKAGLQAMAGERDLAKCRTVFESIDKSAAVTNSVPRVIFERFLMRRYGIDVKFHYVAAKELEEIAQKSELKQAGAKESESDLHKSLDIDYDAAVQPITWQALRDVIKSPDSIIGRALKNKLTIKDWSAFVRTVKSIFDDVMKDVPSSKGKNAQYIPELAGVNPDLFSVTITSVDGQVLSIGNKDTFTVQSCMTGILYSFNLAQVGHDVVHSAIGREPSGNAYNAYVLNQKNKPHNACVNAGAVTNCALYHTDEPAAKRFTRFTEDLQKLAGGVRPSFSHACYVSEKSNAWTNQGLAYYMKSKNSFPPKVDFLDALDFFYQLCSIEVSTDLLSSVAAMYANAGVTPYTNERLLDEECVKDTLRLLDSCGLFSYSGEWACTVGIPASSGVSGAIFFVVPQRVGVCVRAPPLDGHGNSVRGIEFCRRLVAAFHWALLDVIGSK